MPLIINLCRLCGLTSNLAIDLLDPSSKRFALEILQIFHLEINSSNGFPTNLCSECLKIINNLILLKSSSLISHRYFCHALGVPKTSGVVVPEENSPPKNNMPKRTVSTQKVTDPYVRLKNLLRQQSQEIYSLFQEQKMTVYQVLQLKNIDSRLFSAHICEALILGLPVDLDRLGFTEEIKKHIFRIIISPPICGDESKMEQIKNQCNDDVTWDDVRIALAMFKYAKRTDVAMKDLCPDLFISDASENTMSSNFQNVSNSQSSPVQTLREENSDMIDSEELSVVTPSLTEGRNRNMRPSKNSTGKIVQSNKKNQSKLILILPGASKSKKRLLQNETNEPDGVSIPRTLRSCPNEITEPQSANSPNENQTTSQFQNLSLFSWDQSQEAVSTNETIQHDVSDTNNENFTHPFSTVYLLENVDRVVGSKRLLREDHPSLDMKSEVTVEEMDWNRFSASGEDTSHSFSFPLISDITKKSYTDQNLCSNNKISRKRARLTTTECNNTSDSISEPANNQSDQSSSNNEMSHSRQNDCHKAIQCNNGDVVQNFSDISEDNSKTFLHTRTKDRTLCSNNETPNVRRSSRLKTMLHNNENASYRFPELPVRNKKKTSSLTANKIMCSNNETLNARQKNVLNDYDDAAQNFSDNESTISDIENQEVSQVKRKDSPETITELDNDNTAPDFSDHLSDSDSSRCSTEDQVLDTNHDTNDSVEIFKECINIETETSRNSSPEIVFDQELPSKKHSSSKTSHCTDVCKTTQLEKKKLQCPFCDLLYENTFYFKIHLSQEHFLSPEEIADKYVSDVFECKYCDKTFIHKSELKLHSNSHIVQFECNFCDAKLSSKHDLIIHKQVHGELASKLSCFYCNKEQKNKSDLKMHVKSHHKGLFHNFKCRICNLEFKYSSALRNHNKKVHCEVKVNENDFHTLGFQSNTEYICSYCGEKLTNKNRLSLHIQEKHFVHSNSKNSTEKNNEIGNVTDCKNITESVKENENLTETVSEKCKNVNVTGSVSEIENVTDSVKENEKFSEIVNNSELVIVNKTKSLSKVQIITELFKENENDIEPVKENEGVSVSEKCENVNISDSASNIENVSESSFKENENNTEIVSKNVNDLETVMKTENITESCGEIDYNTESVNKIENITETLTISKNVNNSDTVSETENNYTESVKGNDIISEIVTEFVKITVSVCENVNNTESFCEIDNVTESVKQCENTVSDKENYSEELKSKIQYITESVKENYAESVSENENNTDKSESDCEIENNSESVSENATESVTHEMVSNDVEINVPQIHTHLKFNCAHCTKSFKNKTFLSFHIQRKHIIKVRLPKRVEAIESVEPKNLRPRKKSKKLPIFKYNCTECKKKFTTKLSLNKHFTKNHFIPSIHICYKCVSTPAFKCAASLNKHYTHFHSTNELLLRKCDHCGKNFRKGEKFDLHKIYCQHKITKTVQVRLEKIST